MELKEGYKKTEVGIIPIDWKVKPLLEVSTMKGRIGWQGLKKEEFNNKYSDPFLITGMNFKDGEIRWNEVYHVPEDRYEIAKDIQLKDEDVLMTKDGTIGKLLYVSKIPYPFKATLNSHLLLFRPKNKSYDSKFLYYQLSSTYFKQFIEENKSGTTFFGISQESVGKYPVILPSIQEQKAIANSLTDSDNLIQNLMTLVEKKKAIKQGAMQDLLTGKKRLKGFGGGWENKKLGEVTSIQRGASPRPIKDPIWFDEKSNVGWVRISDVTKSKKYLKETVQKLSENGIAKSRYVPSDNLIMSICATIGRPIITQINVCVHDGFVVFNNIEIDKDYLYNYLIFIEEDWSKNGQTGSQINLNTGLINETKLTFPENKDEQKAISKILSDMDAEIEGLEIQLQKTLTLKQGMMQELLSGKIRFINPVNQSTKKESKSISLAAEPEANYNIKSD